MITRARSTPAWQKRLSLGLLLFLLPLQIDSAFAGDIGITYAKTIGQVWPELPMVTGGGRLSVDEKGNLYSGTPGRIAFCKR